MAELEQIKRKIYEIRGQRVMLDRDLASLYGVETRVMNQAVRRNIKRFEGDDFMFRLTKDEAVSALLRSQNVISNSHLENGVLEDISVSRSQIVIMNKGRGHNIKYLPYAFTELGVAMLSSVLKSETAINVNREIMRAFVMFRHLAMQPLPDSNAELRAEIKALRDEMNEVLADQNDINESTRMQLDAISEALAELQSKEPRQKPRRKIGFIQNEEE